MAELWRARVAWTGGPVVGGGVSTFYLQPDTPGIPTALNGFFEAIKALVPLGVSWSVPLTGDSVDAATGKAVGTWGSGPPATKAASGSQTYAAGVGARVVWDTDGWNDGRRVRGSTYVIPLSASTYAADGTLEASAVTAMTNAANAMVTALGTGLVVWSRGPGPDTGRTAAVTGGRAVDKVSWLRSRRT